MSVSCCIKDKLCVCVPFVDTKFNYGACNQAEQVRVAKTRVLRDTMGDPANATAHTHSLLACTVQMLYM
jgi:hypothetical protein